MADSLKQPGAQIAPYLIEGIERVMTPALAIYTDIVDSNIDVTLGLLNGDADRWRPHVKTSKIASVMRRMVERGIENFKCSTTLELMTICEAGARDVLLAYPVTGANARRAREIADQFSDVRLSALVESSEQIEAWLGSRFGLFIDVNPGMDRTGIEQARGEEIISLALAILSAGLEFRGLHYYDGHLSKYDLAERERIAHSGYDRLMEIIAAFERSDITVPEVITAGTPALPCSISYSGFSGASFVHRVSPGTIVYSDCTSLAQLPESWGLRPAAVVISRVVSRPTAHRITCDAGHKAVSADAGVPTCLVLGRADLNPARPSEEHLPIDLSQESEPLALGDTLYLVPRHVCPTVNNFDHAVMIEGGRIARVERVTARGREAPIV
ncbi:MAG TPA: D-TA family PLP-dependent enzyme [Blastocatellia bacterium]|jgi:D-serine deaminase-like pyridoxal phosphate-dependent protein